jgi:hypothetical protein
MRARSPRASASASTAAKRTAREICASLRSSLSSLRSDERKLNRRRLNTAHSITGPMRTRRRRPGRHSRRASGRRARVQGGGVGILPWQHYFRRLISYPAGPSHPHHRARHLRGIELVHHRLDRMHGTHLVAMHTADENDALARLCPLGDGHGHIRVLSGGHLNPLKVQKVLLAGLQVIDVERANDPFSSGLYRRYKLSLMTHPMPGRQESLRSGRSQNEHRPRQQPMRRSLQLMRSTSRGDRDVLPACWA